MADTVWRIEQAVRSGETDAAQALLLMARIGMAELGSVQRSCAVLASAATQQAPVDAIEAYEQALCQLHQQPNAALQRLQQAADGGHVLARNPWDNCASRRPKLTSNALLAGSAKQSLEAMRPLPHRPPG